MNPKPIEYYVNRNNVLECISACAWPVCIAVALTCVLASFSCVSRPPPVSPPHVSITNTVTGWAFTNAPTPRAEWFPGLLVTFPNLPDAATVTALAEAGAYLAPNGTGRVWHLPRYDRHNQFQQTALEAAMIAGATIGPLR